MDFKKVDTKYRPIPLWAWNSRLDTAESKRQAEMMAECGLGGYVMHARGGLQTEYMSEEWFDNVSVGIKEAKKAGMHAWVYDENGWPSGFGDERVNGLGLSYQQKYLRMERGEKHTPRTICNHGGFHFYYDVNPHYVDTLDRRVAERFIEQIYAPYYEKYQTEFEGYFTDEPQLSRNGIPWSLTLPDAYRREYGEELLPKLAQLFTEADDYENTRFRFWKLVTKLFSENFVKPLYEWCSERGLKLTGHLVLEESMLAQLPTNGAVMPHYEYFHIPGMDWLGRDIFDCLTAIQVSSVAAQLGKRQVLSETFALSGHNVGFDELRRIAEWQMVRGITLICQHLQGYSMGGIRKRDYPPAMYYQQPWWEDYPLFLEKISRIGMILTEGKIAYDTLVIHPQSTAWVCFNNGDNAGLDAYEKSLLDTVRTLERKHILFHFGDETIMERHARIEDGRLVIGEQRYRTVVLPPHKKLFDSTIRLLDEFKKSGGVITTADSLPAVDVVDNPHIVYTKRSYDGYHVYYFVNSTDQQQEVVFSVGNKMIDTQTGEILPFSGSGTLQAYDSLMLIDDGGARMETTEPKECRALDLSGEWTIKEMSPNALLLDFCDYYFDGVLVEKKGYVLNIQNRACALERPVNIRCEYTFQAEYLSDELYLVCETPELFAITVNGKRVEKTVCGYYIDPAFRKIDIAEYLCLGENTVVCETHFRQSQSVYETLRKAYEFEGEKNKLTYDMEIEPLYLVGNFGIKSDGAFAKLDRNAVRYCGDFILTKPVTHLVLQHLEQQGLPFFAGSVTLCKTFSGACLADACLQFQKKGINSIKVGMDGKHLATLLWEPYSVELPDCEEKAAHEITLTLTNNLRNLLGPHHLQEGETYWVWHGSFFKESCVWHPAPEEEWNEDYCFVEVSV